MITPTGGGLYGSELTYACTNKLGSYCYDPSYGPPVASTATAVQPYLDSAAKNWGCDWKFSFNAPYQQPTGAWAKWYGTQAENNNGCGVAWWNPNRQAAYFLPNSDRSGNVALASRGATVYTSSTYSSATPESSMIDGNRRGNPWGAGGGWSGRYLPGYPTVSLPDWIQIDFAGPKTLSEIVVSTLQDNYWSPVEPYIDQTFSQHGIRDFSISYWDGSAWIVLKNIYSNNQVYRRVTFSPITTTRIWINITAALNGAARVTEVEAYETNRVSKKVFEKYQSRNLDTGPLGMPISNPIPFDWTNTTSQLFENGSINYRLGNAVAEVVLTGGDTDINVALAHNGGVASSSGAFSTLPVWTINDGRRGSPYHLSIGANAYWASDTTSTVGNCNYGNWWARVDFIAPREISEIDLFSLQDDFWTGTEPTTSTVTNSYGNVDFHLQYCPEGTICSADGSGWVQPAGGYITGNNKAQNSVTFAPVPATAVRALFDCAQSTRAYAVELEAWQRVPEPPVEAGIAPTWTTTSLFAARHNHTATLLSSGKVLVAGGNMGTSTSSSSAELYDPSAGTWGSGGSLTTPRDQHTATLLPSGKVLVTGGSSGFNGPSQPTAELYDPNTNTWSATNSLTTARKNHTATLLPSGKVLVVGGTTQSWDGYLSSAELYDPSTGTWSPGGSLNTPRYGHTATLLLPSGKVLVTGGNGPYADSIFAYPPTVELYDPDTNTWSQTGNLALGRSGATATLLPSGKVLVAGGATSLSERGSTDSAELYDPTTGTWSLAGWLNTARFLHTATLLPSGKVLVTGGRGPYATENPTTLSSTELYDPHTNKWTSTVSLPSPRNNHTATLLSSGAVLVVGGLVNGVSVGSAAVLGAPPTPASVESDIEVGYLNPQLHTVTKSPVVFSRGADQVIVWERKFDGVDLLTDARSAQLPGGNWTTRFLREVSGPEPVRHAEVWTFASAAQAVGLDPSKVHARLVYSPELEQLKKVPNPTKAADVELVVQSYRLTIELVDDDAMTITYVDAYTGEYIEEVPQEMHTTVPTMRYNIVNLDATPIIVGPVTSWVLRDPVRASVLNASNLLINGQGLVSAKPVDLTAELTYLPLRSTADYTNDIAYGLQQSWEYYLTKFGRRGLRDLQRSTTATANDAIVYFEPSTSPNLGMDSRTGVIAIHQDANSKWQGFVTADVIGHEWTHAVWANDTGHRHPKYRWGSNGGLSEANSDLFGQLIEARAKALAGKQPNPDTIDDGWVYGQDAGSTTPTTKRLMCTPSLSPGEGSTMHDTWSPGFEDPKLNVNRYDAMGPLIRVFCLLGRGMLPDKAPNDLVLRSPIVPNGFPALGAEKVGRLQYQALVFLRGYHTPVTYYNQREAMLSAATVLFGEYSPEYKAVQDAFAVINMGPPADRVPPIITLTSGLVMGTSQPISVGVAAANPISSVSFELDGKGLGNKTTPPWQVESPKKPPGQYTLQVTAVDSHRNTATASFVLTLQDTTVPEVCDIAVGPSGGPAGELNVIVSGRDDVSGLSGLDIYQNGVGWVKNDYTPSPPGIGRSLTFTKTFAPGTYTFQGFCGDKAGKIAETPFRSYTVGSPAPPCNTTAVAGSNAIDQRVWEMGKTSGNVTLTYQTFVVHDRVKVLYQGSVIADTGCRATGGVPGQYGTPTWSLSFQYSGSSSQVTVRVEPNCDSTTAGPGTQWNYKLSCP